MEITFNELALAFGGMVTAFGGAIGVVYTHLVGKMDSGMSALRTALQKCEEKHESATSELDNLRKAYYELKGQFDALMRARK
jgi:hypothetical protein